MWQIIAVVVPAENLHGKQEKIYVGPFGSQQAASSFWTSGAFDVQFRAVPLQVEIVELRGPAG